MEYHEEMELLTTAESARYLRVSMTHMYRISSERTIRKYKVGRRVLFDRRDLDAYIRAAEVESIVAGTKRGGEND